MALVLNDRVKETTTTTGTGTVNLAGAETGFETFVAGIGNTNTTYYAIVHQSADEFEVGLGTVSDSSPDTLSRTTIISSSNSDSAVNFSAGTKDVFCTLPASKAVFVDGSGDLEFNAPGDEFSFKNSSNTIAFIKTDNNDFTIQNNLNDKDFILKGYDADGSGLITGLTIDYSDAGRAMFNGSVDIGGSAITKTGDLTLDVSGDITLDAGGDNIKFHDSGTEVGQIDLGSQNLTLRSSVSDKDMIFRVNDGGSEIVAMTVDASESANIKVESGNVLMETAGKYFQVAGSSSTFWAIGSTGGNNAPGTGSTSLAFHHWDGSAWNNEVEFDSSGNITLDGSIVFSNNSKLRQDSAGLIMETLDSDEDLLFVGNDGGSTITAARLDMSDAGHLICNGNVTAFGSTSDIKLKENIEVIPDALDKVKQLKGITFNYKKDGKKSTGLIAQDLEKVLPEAVYEASSVDDDEDKHLAVRYGNTVGLLVEAIKELEARVKELEDK